MADESSVRNVVEHINFTCHSYIGEAPPLVHRNLADLIPQCPRLKSISVHLDATDYNHFFLPFRLFEIIESLQPTVSLDLGYNGGLAESQAILGAVTCLRSCSLSLVPPRSALDFSDPPQSVDFSFEGILRQTRLECVNLPGDWPRWKFKFPLDIDPERLLHLKELNLNTIDGSHRQLIESKVINLEALRKLTFDGLKVFTSAIAHLMDCVPNVRVCRVTSERPYEGNYYFPRTKDWHYLVDENQLGIIRNCFSRATLHEIALDGFVQNLPWQDMFATSGRHLRQLTIHTGINRWYEIKRRELATDFPSFEDSFEAASLRKRSDPFGFTHAEILRLGSVCPNIQHLGLDIHIMGPTEALQGPLDALMSFAHLGHLRLFFLEKPNPHRDRRRNRNPNPSYFCGEELLKIFLHFRERKRGTLLETLLCQMMEDTNSYHPHESCMLWAMGEGKTLINYSECGYRYVSETYQGTQLVRTRLLVRHAGMHFHGSSQFVFPG